METIHYILGWVGWAVGLLIFLAIVLYISVTTPGCIKRPVKWFGVEVGWRECEYQLEDITFQPWGAPEWHNWQYWKKCKHCGAHKHVFGATDADVMHLGHNISERK